MTATLKEQAFKALNRLAKWRAIYAGWQLGTRSKDDPECAAVRDHREATLLLRADVSALVSLLLRKGIIIENELYEQIVLEAAQMQTDLEKFFPGFSAVDNGIDVDVEAARETTKGWKP